MKLFENKFFQFLAFVLIIVFVVFLLSSIGKNMQEGEINTITVMGEGELYATPDIAVIDISVLTEDDTVAEAMQSNSEKMNNIINGLQMNLSIAEEDMQTTNFNVYPQYRYDPDTGERSIDGYNVSQNVNVKIRNLDIVGQVIQLSTNLGANSVSDLSFTFDDDNELQSQAREKAIENAKKKAEELADQLGVRMVKIVDFSENSSAPIYATSISYKAYDVALESSATPSIATGENKITSSVYITYLIK